MSLIEFCWQPNNVFIDKKWRIFFKPKNIIPQPKLFLVLSSWRNYECVGPLEYYFYAIFPCYFFHVVCILYKFSRSSSALSAGEMNGMPSYLEPYRARSDVISFTSQSVYVVGWRLWGSEPGSSVSCRLQCRRQVRCRLQRYSGHGRPQITQQRFKWKDFCCSALCKNK